MRDDSFGMFWNDVPTERGRSTVVRPMPPIPDTGWRTPTEFPNLRGARVIALDTETKDPNLLERGPGWARGDGHIVGVSIAVDGGAGAWYFPVRHEIEPEYNMDPAHVFAWLRDTLANPHQPKVGANLVYDIGWLAEENVHPAGELVDVQHAEALLNERGEVNLGALGEKYLGVGKETNTLYEWLAMFYGGKPDGKQRANIYRSPPRLVGPYAERDAVLPLLVARAQYPLLVAEGLMPVLNMENGLIRLMVAMRRAGVRVDLDRAAALRDKLLAMETQAQTQLDALAGMQVEVNSADSIARAFDAKGLKYPRTKGTEKKPDGSPSFTKDWLALQTTPLAALVTEVRKLEKLRRTFVESYVLDANVNGMVYGQFHLLRSDSSGTRSGRFSSSDPNLQNLPSRDEELAPLVRDIFVPDYGHKQWRRYDYSQIEYRFLVHYAEGPGADEARAMYHSNPDMDYHDFVIELIAKKTGFKLARKPAKNINFGLIYGMGVKRLLRTLGLSKQAGKELFGAYHTAIPYAKNTMEACSSEAARTGVMTTILGRRSRFDLWSPAGRHGGDEDDTPALPLEQALRFYGAGIERAHLHKALNRRLQGSAADMMKFCMWRCWEDGVFAATGVPRLTVHDELDFSDPGGCDEAFAHCQHVLEHSLPLRVPVQAAAEIGPSWGSVA
jgi:DNA polymerase I-like protein with 3'-5' exonuclease and polymerase domains